MPNIKSLSLILQSHYPNRRSPDGRWAKIGKIGRRRPIDGRHRHRFWLIFWSADKFFCRSTQVKSFVDRSADFQGFCHRRSVGRWSPDDRPTVGRLFEEIFIMLSAEGRPFIGRQSADDRQTIGRWHFTKELSVDRLWISAVSRPMIARLSTDHKLWFMLYCLQWMFPHNLWN